MEVETIVLSVSIGGFVVLSLYLYESLVLNPKRLRSKLEKQGIRGPLPSSLLGNIPEMKKIKLEISSRTTTTTQNDHLQHVVSVHHDWFSTLFPHLFQWRAQHGTFFSIYIFFFINISSYFERLKKKR